MNKLKQLIYKERNWLLILLLSISIAIVSHTFFILEWFDGKFMTGPGDGLSQMLPFKQLLYEQYTTGNFFYSDRFGLGGGTYSQLSYYFSTSLFFIGSVALTYMLELCGVIDQPTIFYWANTLIPISIIRVTLMMFVTTKYFKYMKIGSVPAFVGAVLYSTSVIYFRHVTYWEFFADAMLWLPILLYGVEKVIREQKAGWFVVALVLCLFNNFYFAYINILLASMYIICRWFIKLDEDETTIFVQIKQYIVGGLIAFGISAVSFIPAVYGYFHNHRIAYEAEIPLLLPMDNPFLDGRIIVIPAFAMICLLIRPFYQEKRFAFYAYLMLISIVFHMSPIVGSAFNGFSAPQYRWEYFLAFVFAGVIAVSLEQMNRITKKHLIIAISGLVLLYSVSYVVDPVLSFTNWQSAYLVYVTIATILIVIRLMMPFGRRTMAMLVVFLVISSLFTSNFYQYVKLSQEGDVQSSTKEWMHSEAYYSDDQRALLQRIQDEEEDEFYRIDWMTPSRNNTPIVQQFNGFSVYSSILNHHLLYFYLYDVEIDTGKESVSRYGTVGNRANLASVLAGKYYIAKKGDLNVPFGFYEKYTVGDYTAYENEYVLPFVRTTKQIYTEAQLANASPLERERAMIDGIILKAYEGKVATVQHAPDFMKDVTIREKGATFENNRLTVTEKSGGIDLVLDESSMADTEDYYVSFQLQRLDQDRQFTLHVNEYKTLRKKNSSIYKTGVDNLTIRVSAAPEISIRLPKGTYTLTDLQLFGENYEVLKKNHQSSSDISYEWEKNRLEVSFNNVEQAQFMQLPIPFEKGWQAYVNGEEQEVLQANYAFIGLALEEGQNDIKLVYSPPYFKVSLIVSCLSLVFALFVYSQKGRVLLTRIVKRQKI